MSELLIELHAHDGAEKIMEALRSKPSARKITVYAIANDRVHAIERIREFLVENTSRTVIVYAKSGG